jgi:hypothetical protein
MTRLIAFAVLALGVTVSAQAMPVAPVQGPDIITQAAYGCGPGMTRVAGVCVARTTKRQARRCIRWTGGVLRRVALLLRGRTITARNVMRCGPFHVRH